MKKSKIILLYSILLTTTFLIKINGKDFYYIPKTEIKGKMISCEAKTDKTNITIKNKEKILINYAKKYNCVLGTTIKAKGITKKIENNRIPNTFNYKKYLLSKNIKYIFEANQIKNIKENKNILYKIKNILINHINKYKSKNYLKAFILADQSEIEKEASESYRNNGISHLLAISGTQISIIMFIINKLLKNKHNVIKITFLIFYTFLTTLSPSIIRATLSYIAINFKNKLKIDIKKEYILLLILLIMLNINPYYIYNIGFKLSFIVSFFLIHYKDLINTKNYLKKTFIISVIAFISSFPILININHEANFLSPILNLYFTPLIVLIIYPLSLLTILIKPLDNILYKVTTTTEIISQKISTKNFLTFNFSHINIIRIIVYYIIIIIFLDKTKENKKFFVIPFISIMFFYYNINYFNHTIKISYLDVGQGDSILLKLSNNKGSILIDTGGTYSDFDITNKKTIPYLKSEGIKKINYLITSHGDYDHMGEAINLVNNFKVEKVIFNCGEYNDLEKELIKVLDKKHIKYYSCIKELDMDNNKLYFLQTKEYDNENDNSNVIYMELNSYKFMFMGDAGVEKEKDILNKYNISDIDVLKVGHHGSKTSSGKNFINEINPKYSIISVGKNNRYGHPNKEVLNNLDNSKIYRTDKQGSIMFKIKNNKLKIETCSP